MTVPAFFAQGRGARWLDGFLLCQHRLPRERRVPVFVGSPDDAEDTFPAFRRWHARRRPDALLTFYGHEQTWLQILSLRAPDDLGLACVIRPPGSAFHAGINDRYGDIGAAAVELVASKITLNQFGVPACPKFILIEGEWVHGKSAPHVGKKQPLVF